MTNLTWVQTLCCLLCDCFSFLWNVTSEFSSLCLWCSSCPPSCTVMTGRRVPRFLVKNSPLFSSHSGFHFHEKKQEVWVSDTLTSAGKLHFWSGAEVVGPILVIVHLLAPASLTGPSPGGAAVGRVWARVGDTAPVVWAAGYGKVNGRGRLLN